jgi:hypothetical protein
MLSDSQNWSANGEKKNFALTGTELWPFGRQALKKTADLPLPLI